MKAKGLLALVAVASVTAAVAASQAFGAATWTVDQSTGTNNCAGNVCKTIAKAVQKAAAGDTINVHPGTYTENVTVGKKLTIKASHSAPDTLSCNDNRTDPDDTVYAVLDSSGGPSFDITTGNVTIQGFIFQNASGNAVQTGLFTGYTFKNNLFQDNNVALYLNSTGTTSVSGNCFRNNVTGISSDLGLKSATISQNHFFTNSLADLLLTGSVNPAVQTVTISQNGSDSSGFFLILSFSKAVTVSQNTIANAADALGPDSAAILLTGSNATFKVSGNLIKDGAASGIVADSGGNDPNTGTISGNIVTGNTGDGLYVPDGLAFVSLKGSTVNSNIFNGNGDDGIHVEKQTPAAAKPFNTFTANIAQNNGVHDCHDQPQNKNVWTGNTNLGVKVNKMGWCFPGNVISGPQSHLPF